MFWKKLTSQSKTPFCQQGKGYKVHVSAVTSGTEDHSSEVMADAYNTLAAGESVQWQPVPKCVAVDAEVSVAVVVVGAQ